MPKSTHNKSNLMSLDDLLRDTEDTYVKPVDVKPVDVKPVDVKPVDVKDKVHVHGVPGEAIHHGQRVRVAGSNPAEYVTSLEDAIFDGCGLANVCCRK